MRVVETLKHLILIVQQTAHSSSLLLPGTGAGAAVLVFSTTDQASFHAVKRWKEKVRQPS